MTPFPGVPSQSRSRADYGILLATRILRAFAFGFAQVLIGLHLAWLGFNPAMFGIAVAVGVLAAALSGVPAAAASHRIGRRFVLFAAGMLMSLSGIILAGGPSQIAALAGVTGMLGVGGIDLGPFLAVEQPMLAQTVVPSRRNIAFGRYSLTGALAGAGGALSAGLVTDLGRSRAFFAVFAAVGLITAVLPLLLSDSVEEVPPEKIPSSHPRLGVTGLALLFLLDSTGGGFMSSTLQAYWLHVRFGASAQLLGPYFALTSMIQAVSYEVSPRIANRVGLVRTIALINVGSSLLLVTVPFSPSLSWALIVLFVRAGIVNIDVPIRQAYIVSIVPAYRRSDAIAITSAARGIGQSAGPVLFGICIQLGNLSIPFFVGGALKTAYAVTLYARYKDRTPDIL